MNTHTNTRTTTNHTNTHLKNTTTKHMNNTIKTTHTTHTDNNSNTNNPYILVLILTIPISQHNLKHTYFKYIIFLSMHTIPLQ